MGDDPLKHPLRREIASLVAASELRVDEWASGERGGNVWPALNGTK